VLAHQVKETQAVLVQALAAVVLMVPVAVVPVVQETLDLVRDMAELAYKYLQRLEILHLPLALQALEAVFTGLEEAAEAAETLIQAWGEAPVVHLQALEMAPLAIPLQQLHLLLKTLAQAVAVPVDLKLLLMEEMADRAW
jgi:hypothetical protein